MRPLFSAWAVWLSTGTPEGYCLLLQVLQPPMSAQQLHDLLHMMVLWRITSTSVSAGFLNKAESIEQANHVRAGHSTGTTQACCTTASTAQRQAAFEHLWDTACIKPWPKLNHAAAPLPLSNPLNLQTLACPALPLANLSGRPPAAHCFTLHCAGLHMQHTPTAPAAYVPNNRTHQCAGGCKKISSNCLSLLQAKLHWPTQLRCTANLLVSTFKLHVNNLKSCLTDLTSAQRPGQQHTA